VEIMPRLERIGERLYLLAYRFRRSVARTAYVSLAALAYAASYLLRFDFSWPSEYTATFLSSLALLLIVRLLVNYSFALSTGRWRFVSTRDVLRLGLATSVGTAVFFPLTLWLPFTPAVPRSVILIEWLLTTFLTAGLWLAYRTAYEQLRHLRSGFNGNAKRVLIVGAGEAGNLLAREIRRFPTGYRALGFVDDDPTKRRMRLNGLDVLGATEDMPRIVLSTRAEEIIIALPSALPPELRRIVEACEATGLKFKVLPGIAEVLAGDVQINHVRDVRIEDLLGREPIRLRLPELAADLAGRSVLITGAAGSIGSELARQVALHRPATLVLLDQAETDLFYLEMELRERHPDLRIVPVIGDIVDAGAVDRVFREYAFARIYHAAAYKHVPMMECNPHEAVRNNVVGTWRVAEAAGRHGVAKFVLVSTDKAVRPVSVMGATKQLAERIVLELQERFPNTSYAAVRFGNVLGSSGSVIPILKRQIERGQPLTVTHPDATRFFMTIAEAVQLILQASLLAEVRGSVATLEMGEPVRIADLAKNLLDLSAVRRDGGSHIVYTGLRPGERLHEKLVAPDEETLPTTCPKVRVVRSRSPRAVESASISQWERLCELGPESAVLDAIAELCPSLRAPSSEEAERFPGTERRRSGDSAVVPG
jgi:FlaA1/EpsC-like NDP-sugar epimerase